MTARAIALQTLLVACAAPTPAPQPLPATPCPPAPAGAVEDAPPAPRTERPGTWRRMVGHGSVPYAAPALPSDPVPPSPATCPPLHVVTPELARTPHFNLGNTRVYLAPCVEPGGSPAKEGAREDKACGHAKRGRFESCPADTVGSALSVATFIRNPPPAGTHVDVRGRLGLSGPQPSDGPATLGLISGREHHDMCVMLNLSVGNGGPAGLWRCTPPSERHAAGACCNESRERPPTGVDIVVRGTVKRLLVGQTAQIYGLADLEADTFCVIREAK